MAKFLIKYIVLSLATWIAFAQDPKCASLPRYVYRADSKNYEDAKLTCANMNARLAVANTEEEAILLSNLLQHSQTTFQEAWIGRYFDGNIWTTVDGIAVADSGYEGWADGEPNRLRRTRADNSIEFEACGSLHWNMQHNDDYCTSTHPFICEFYNSPCTNL